MALNHAPRRPGSGKSLRSGRAAPAARNSSRQSRSPSAQGTALQDTAPLSIIPVNVGVGVGDNTTSSTARLTTVQANLSSQRSTTVAASSQDGIGNGIDANGGDGKAFMITIGSNNTRIDNTSVSKIEVDTSINVADQAFGVAGGLRIDDSFNPIKIEDSLNDNAIAIDGFAATLNHNSIED